jgi:hypothetical protein
VVETDEPEVPVDWLDDVEDEDNDVGGAKDEVVKAEEVCCDEIEVLVELLPIERE